MVNQVWQGLWGNGYTAGSKASPDVWYDGTPSLVAAGEVFCPAKLSAALLVAGEVFTHIVSTSKVYKIATNVLKCKPW